MNSLPKFGTWVVARVLATALMAQLCGCGTLLYPERVGQQRGRIDPGVAIMDGLGLLLFVVPGVVAFVVDFSNGAIYLPDSYAEAGEPSEQGGYLVITPQAEALTEREIEVALRQQLGQEVDLSAEGVRMLQLDALQTSWSIQGR